MFDLGWTELMVVGIVALIVVGPKDLPGMFRTLGRFTGKARRMAREFQRAMEDAADEAGVKDVANTVKTAANPGKAGLDALKDAAKFDTPSLSEERAEAARKIHAATASKEASRRAAEAAEDIAEELADDVAEAATEAAAEASKST